MVNADDLRDAQPWQPMTNAIDLAHLGKLGEELNEAGSAASRCIIQGIDEAEPETGKINREWLEDEFADVIATIALVTMRFKLDEKRIDARLNKKMAHLQQWFAKLEPNGK